MLFPQFLGVFIVGAKRTAFGTFGGAFRNTTQTQLQTTAAKAAIAASGLQPEHVDTVVIGHIMTVIFLKFYQIIKIKEKLKLKYTPSFRPLLAMAFIYLVM